jgi:dynactin complex subunit
MLGNHEASEACPLVDSRRHKNEKQTKKKKERVKERNASPKKERMRKNQRQEPPKVQKLMEKALTLKVQAVITTATVGKIYKKEESCTLDEGFCA